MTTLLQNIQKSIFTFAVLLISSAFIHVAHAQTTVDFTTAGATTWEVPAGVTSITIEAWGAGGCGGKRTSTGRTGGGGGGAYSRTTALAVSPGQTIYINVGAGGDGSSATPNPGGDSWARAVVNAAPTSVSEGALAKGGGSVANNSVNGGVGGNAASGIGNLTYSGGNGATQSLTAAAGGGSSAGTAANGNNATDATGATAPSGGGNGGNGNNNTGSAPGFSGLAPGGGGGGSRSTMNSVANGGMGGTGKISITYNASVSNTVTTGTISGSPYCITPADGANISVPFTTTGTFGGSNVFSAQLSGPTGVFPATPTVIGTGSSPTISATIPAGTAAGSGYRIRVVASDPSTIGTDNGINLQVINAPTNVTALSGASEAAQVPLGWTNPSSCFDQVLVVASTSSISGTPSGSPTANANYGSGSSLLGGFVVYIGMGNNVTVTGLNNGTPYFFRVFTRFGTSWSAGVQTSVTPVEPPEPGEILIGWEMATTDGAAASVTGSFYEIGVSTVSPSGVMSRGSGLTAGAGGIGAFRSRNFTSGSTIQNAIDNNSYITFRIAPLAGYRLNISSFDFTFTRGNATSSPDKLQLRSSIDGFTTFQDYGQIDLPASTLPQIISVITPGLVNITVPIEFRLYGYDASNSLSTGNFVDDASSLNAPYDVAVMGTAVPNTWTGAVSNVWNLGGNWSFGTVPNSGDDALIPSISAPNFNPVISGLTPLVNRITLNSGANLTIASDGALTVNTRITNNGLLTVNSGGALVQPIGSTTEGTGTYTIRRQIPGSNNGFRFLGSPIKNLSVIAIGGITANGPDGGQVIPLADCNISNVAAGSPFGNILELRENPIMVLEGCAQSLWHVKSTGLLQNGRGYAMRASGGQTINFSGSEVNNGNVELTSLTRQSGNLIDHISGNVSRGWHLVCNPYPSPITLVGNTHLVPQGFDGQIQLYNSATGAWEAPQPPSAAVTIAVGQAFQIRKTNEGGSSTLTLNNGMRVPNTGVNYFNTNEWFDYKFEMKVNGNGNQDNTIIFFHPEASDAFDPTMDVNKMTGPIDMPLLFTMTNDERMAYNGLPLLETPRIIPMSFYPGTQGNYSLSIDHLETLPSTMMIYLEDKKTGVWTNLRTSTNYTFTASLSDDIQRFALHLEPPVSISSESETCATGDGSIIINNPSNLIWNVLVNGEVVNAGSGLTTIDGLIAGNYELTISSGAYSANESVQIETTTFEAPEIEVLQQNLDEIELIRAEVINPIADALYIWEINGLNIGNGPSVEFAINQAGSYDLSLKTHWNNCTALSSHNLTANPIVSSAKPSELISDLSVFPNPSNGIFNIVWNNSAGKNFEQVIITDQAGRVLKQFDIAAYAKGNQMQVDLNEYQNGTYFVHLTSSGQVQTIKVGVVK